jgi:hypothetical protein
MSTLLAEHATDPWSVDHGRYIWALAHARALFELSRPAAVQLDFAQDPSPPYFTITARLSLEVPGEIKGQVTADTQLSLYNLIHSGDPGKLVAEVLYLLHAQLQSKLHSRLKKLLTTNDAISYYVPVPVKRHRPRKPAPALLTSI